MSNDTWGEEPLPPIEPSPVAPTPVGRGGQKGPEFGPGGVPGGEPPIGPPLGVAADPKDPEAGPGGVPGGHVPEQPLDPVAKDPQIGPGGVPGGHIPVFGGPGSVGAPVNVDPLHLSQLAKDASRVGEDIVNSVKGVVGSLGQAGPSSGPFQLSAALSECANGWERAINSTAKAVAGVGERLGTTVTNYSGVDASNAKRFEDLMPPLN